MIARKLRIHGRVQGVGFRYSAWLEAKRLQVAGWVRNRRDGSVELYLLGEADAVAQLEDWAHRGPNAAYVENVEAEDSDIEDCAGFAERPTV
ncbi:acylphosphatase [Chitiniphilus eburneus]|uniref:Acylphosphatase n=2 Tax=Chitiniphilus eburneus TaxID=2571148 RepID=A0A4U0PER1_9NEIS|nr:acylphosphatase [Chitiniphilus eburneus]